MNYYDIFYLKPNAETLKLINGIIENGDIDTPDKCGDTLLGTAIRFRRIDAIELLLACGADVNELSGNQYTLELAAWIPDFFVIRRLFEYGAKIESDNHMLAYAVSMGADFDLVAYLLKKGCDPNDRYGDEYDTENVLWWALQHHNTEVVKLLLENGADPNVIFNNETCLKKALAESFFPGIKLLIEYGADVNLCAPLSTAVVWCYPAVKLLLDAGADINARDNESGRTILFEERVRKHFERCDYLIRLGADPTIKDNDGIDFYMLDDEKIRKTINDEWGYCDE